MGRGRAKAKQTKVARELKYFSPDTDLSALERELHSARSEEPEGTTDYSSAYADDTESVEDERGDEFDDYERWAATGR